MPIEDWKFAVKPDDVTVYSILIDGKDSYTGYTEADYISRGYLVLSYGEFHEMEEERENLMCGKWLEITEDDYERALNMFPPLKWYDGGFFNPEMLISNVTDFYQELNGKYYTSLQRTSSDRAFLLQSLELSIEFGAIEDRTQEE